LSRNWYERIVLPHLLELTCGVKPIRRQRQKVVPLARGEVLEIGIGTGLNLPFYDRSRVKSIVGVDPALELHPLALRRVAQTGLSVRMVGLSAETLPLPDHGFDTIVCTYTLCTIPDPATALAEMRRVLAPGGKLLFSEHGRAPDESVRRWQQRLQPLWGPLAGGCQLGRDISALLEAAGFRLAVQSMYLPGPRFTSYHYWGEAVAR
jgi:ubiquinone/menaquinone biosynthesis C-methylase UbiE